MLRAAAIALACATVAVGACGEGEEDADVEDVGAAAPAAADFPQAEGGTLEDVLAEATPTNEIIVAPAGAVYEPGSNRIGFGVFNVARHADHRRRGRALRRTGERSEAIGPYPAKIDSLETDPEFEARTTADDPDSAKAVYTTERSWISRASGDMGAVIRQDGELLSTRLQGAVIVDDYSKIPDVGEKAPAVKTPTVSDVGDISEIDTRDPHDTMHDEDASQTIGKEPTVLLFATPALCVSRVCGPVVDVAEQVKAELGDDAAFIHMEVFEDNNPNEGVRPQLMDYGLQTEPWLFVIDADGNVSTRIEGAFSVDELRDAVADASS